MLHTQNRSVVVHAGLFIQTQEADVLIRPNCGLTPSRKPLTIAALDLELPRGILTKVASYSVHNVSSYVLSAAVMIK